MKLTRLDLQRALFFLPRRLLHVMAIDPAWTGKIFVGGGYLRSVVSGEPVNDVDVFVSSRGEANLLAAQLSKNKEGKEDCTVYRTDNALTIRGLGKTVQIIHRWVFEKGEDVANSFDFTVCCAVFWRGITYKRNGLGDCYEVKEWQSYCDDRFYPDLAAKRLHYRSPIRNEDAGGSMLRVLKYYQKGYRIPLDSLGAVIARLMEGVKDDGLEARMRINGLSKEQAVAEIVTGLLREVDPDIDPKHLAHLPAEE